MFFFFFFLCTYSFSSLYCYSATDLGKSSLDVTIDAASVDTRVEMRDNDVRSAHFLDTAKYPTITFKSKKVETAGAGKLKVTGDLTLHGVTKEVVLDVDGPDSPDEGSTGEMSTWARRRLRRSVVRILV